MSTIFAVSSGRPPAAVALLRISGPEAMSVGTALAGRLPAPRRAGLRLLRRSDGAALDRALVLVFPGPNSATGEDLVELHCHGGRAVVAAVEAALAEHPGCRAAEPGEFTRRALANGRIDLSEAEGLADLLEAETEAERVAALGASEGRVSRAVADWISRIADLSGRVEAILDHSDDDDVASGDEEVATIARSAAALGAEIAQIASQPPVERLRDGVRVVIAGPPNAGKSTLLNLLSDRKAAIVSATPGTTRDRIEAGVVRSGSAFTLIDTAGLRNAHDPIERAGVELTHESMGSADILLWLGDTPPPRADAIWVQAKADLFGRQLLAAGRTTLVRQDSQHSVERLWEIIASRAREMMPRADALPMRQRHLSLCLAAAETLLSAPSDDALLLAEHLAFARRRVATVTGVDATEEMLDALFSRFCLGK